MAFTANPALTDRRSTCATSNSLRRSYASASAPPMSDPAMSGTSAARPSRPTISDERVSTYTWYGAATTVIWLPRNERIWPP